jgi:CRISPR/Cas system Type II protein with McrA/HNH and RuvC-like nuclease domain
MSAVKPAYVKNVIRRGLSELVDPSPTRCERLAIWSYFQDCCAYCGQQLRRGSKEAHIDHLVPTSVGGANGMGNRVLSCASCNEKEKREQPWEEFLKSKVRSPEQYSTRRQRILDWQKEHPMVTGPDHQKLIDLASEKANEISDLFEQSVDEIRRRARALRRT